MTAQQLKNSILQMAVQGKLVLQDPNDEPASVLIQKIRDEKEQMIKDGKIKEEKNPSFIFRGDDGLFYEKVGNKEPVCIEDELPFEIPESWEFANLKTVCQLTDGKKKSNHHYPIMDVKFLRGNEEVKYSDGGKYVSKGTKVILVDGDNSGEVFTVPQDGYMGSTFKELWISGELCKAYVLYFIDFYRDLLKKSKKGVAIPHLNKELFYGLYLPIPPLSEQQRIANTLSEIQSYITRYSYYEDTLDLLNDNFPNEMKNSILQQAVQGKLVPQDPDDEPASVLVERIHNERRQLIKDGKIKRDKHESVIYGRNGSYYEKVNGKGQYIVDEIPFEIPDSWEWVRLKNMVSFIGGFAYKSADFVTNSDNQVLRLGNVKNNKLKLDQKPVYISDTLAHNTVNFRCRPYDILITMTGTRGKRDYFFSVMITEDNNLYINQRVGILRPLCPFMSNWLNVVLKSECVLGQVFQYETGTANQGNLGAENILNTLIPIPPEREQNCIVGKVNQLMQIMGVT